MSERRITRLREIAYKLMMSIPADLDQDADLLIEWAVDRITKLEALLSEHVIAYENDLDWDEAAWHEKAVALLGDYLERTESAEVEER